MSAPAPAVPHLNRTVTEAELAKVEQIYANISSKSVADAIIRDADNLPKELREKKKRVLSKLRKAGLCPSDFDILRRKTVIVNGVACVRFIGWGASRPAGRFRYHEAGSSIPLDEIVSLTDRAREGTVRALDEMGIDMKLMKLCMDVLDFDLTWDEAVIFVRWLDSETGDFRCILIPRQLDTDENIRRYMNFVHWFVVVTLLDRIEAVKHVAPEWRWEKMHILFEMFLDLILDVVDMIPFEAEPSIIDIEDCCLQVDRNQHKRKLKPTPKREKQIEKQQMELESRRRRAELEAKLQIKAKKNQAEKLRLKQKKLGDQQALDEGVEDPEVKRLREIIEQEFDCEIEPGALRMNPNEEGVEDKDFRPRPGSDI